MYEFRYERGHIAVYLHGVFQFSADTMKEAADELAFQLYGSKNTEA
jgi:hypothetical protein